MQGRGRCRGKGEVKSDETREWFLEIEEGEDGKIGDGSVVAWTRG